MKGKFENENVIIFLDKISFIDKNYGNTGDVRIAFIDSNEQILSGTDAEEFLLHIKLTKRYEAKMAILDIYDSVYSKK